MSWFGLTASIVLFSWMEIILIEAKFVAKCITILKQKDGNRNSAITGIWLKLELWKCSKNFANYWVICGYSSMPYILVARLIITSWTHFCIIVSSCSCPYIVCFIYMKVLSTADTNFNVDFGLNLFLYLFMHFLYLWILKLNGNFYCVCFFLLKQTTKQKKTTDGICFSRSIRMLFSKLEPKRIKVVRIRKHWSDEWVVYADRST